MGVGEGHACEKGARMRYDIRDDDGRVQILVAGVSGRSPQLLAALQNCQEGRCGCPTNEYDRLAAMEVGGGEDEVRIRLDPKPGERLDAEQVAACLDYTLSQLDGE